MSNVDKALEMVADGMTLGLGSGAASERFVTELGGRVKAGLKVCGVPTSNGTADLARRVGVPLVELADAIPLDICFDGADEVAPSLDLLKGWGKALVREKIVAAAAKKFVVLVGPQRVEEKIVPALGSRGRLPVEVVPFALPLCIAKIKAECGYASEPLRTPTGDLLVTDNGNYLLDVKVGPIADPAELERKLLFIPGVVGTGLFLGMSDVVLIEKDGQVEVREGKRG